MDPLLRFPETPELVFCPVSVSVNELDLLVSFRFGESPLLKISRLKVCVQRRGSCFVRVLDFLCVREGDVGGLSRRHGEDCLRVTESPREVQAGEGDLRRENEKG